MIIIGNSNILKYENNWLELMNICMKNNSWKGEAIKEKIKKPNDCLTDNRKEKSIIWSHFLPYQSKVFFSFLIRFFLNLIKIEINRCKKKIR